MTSNNDLVKISADPISQEEVTRFVTDPSAGGISIFLGVTRDNFEGKKVVQLEYEAYLSMAVKQLSDICTTVREKWPVTKIALIHRTGVVPVGEPSVIIAVSAVHRKEALEATSFAIDAIKSSLAIWKKEVYAEGGGVWKENNECRWT